MTVEIDRPRCGDMQEFRTGHDTFHAHQNRRCRQHANDDLERRLA